ncbi:MAG: hypothetical protein JXA82_17510 [Sedimentisphaerales bacterium]|nr:hypothetical protein [Sedimentisphaerales bacterium]
MTHNQGFRLRSSYLSQWEYFWIFLLFPVFCPTISIATASVEYRQVKISAFSDNEYTVLLDVNKNGHIVGGIELPGGIFQGFILYDPNSGPQPIGTLNPGNFGSSQLNAINDSDVAVGWSTDLMGKEVGILYRNGNMERITPPEGYMSVRPLDINNRGDIVMLAFKQSTEDHVVFLLEADGTYHWIVETNYSDIKLNLNDNGTLTGDLPGHPFVYDTESGFRHLDTIMDRIHGINNQGQILGAFHVDDEWNTTLLYPDGKCEYFKLCQDYTFLFGISDNEIVLFCCESTLNLWQNGLIVSSIPLVLFPSSNIITVEPVALITSDGFILVNLPYQPSIYVPVDFRWPPYCKTQPAADITGDCCVDMEDLAAVAAQWMQCNLE